MGIHLASATAVVSLRGLLTIEQPILTTCRSSSPLSKQEVKSCHQIGSPTHLRRYPDQSWRGGRISGWHEDFGVPTSRGVPIRSVILRNLLGGPEMSVVAESGDRLSELIAVNGDENEIRREMKKIKPQMLLTHEGSD